MEILDSRAAVCVQLYLISIVGNHEKGDAALLRESEYLLEAAAICTTRNRKMERWFYFVYHFLVIAHLFIHCFLLLRYFRFDGNQQRYVVFVIPSKVNWTPFAGRTEFLFVKEFFYAEWYL